MISSPEAPVAVNIPETNPGVPEIPNNPVVSEPPKPSENPENGKSLMDSIRSFLSGFRQSKEQSQASVKPVIPQTYEEKDEIPKSNVTRATEENAYFNPTPDTTEPTV